MTGSSILRPLADADDRAACGAVFVEAFLELHRRQGFIYPGDHEDDAAFIASALEHFCVTDPGLQWLAEDGGRVVAFTSAWRRDGYWFLAFLFVRPEAQSSGVGRDLLRQVMPPVEQRDGLTMSTVIESTQPVSQGLYARYGMVPRVPRTTIGGVPAEGMLPDELPPGVWPEPLEGVPAEELDGFEREHLGYARGPHHERFRAGKGFAFAYRRDGRLAGLGYATRDEDVGLRTHPILTDDAALTPAIIGHLARHAGGGRIQLPLYGGAVTLMPLLLRAGLRVVPWQEEEHFPFLYCSTGPALDADRVIPYSGYLP